MLRAHDAVHGIGRGTLAAEVVAHLQFAEHADGQHLNTRDDKHRSDNEHGAVLIHHIDVRIKELNGQQRECHGAAGEDTQDAESAKEVQRAGHVLEQEANGHQVKEDPESAGNAVMTLAAPAVHVVDGYLANGRAIPTC